MKLPDFLENAELNQLRHQMAAKLIPWKPIDQLLRTEGISVEPEDIRIAPDGTLEYEGRKIAVYIRDQIVFRQSSTSSYRFHVADCITLNKMYQKGRYERYVVATRTDGKFYVNFLKGGRLIEKGVERKLYVCINCLKRINYKNYDNPGGPEKNEIRESFDLKEFFEQYGSRITRNPGHDDGTAPVNEYPSNQKQISDAYREKIGWKCEECDINLRDHKKFLHVHHRDGQKHNNSEQNLRALCIGCHTKQFQHQHMKVLSDYEEFLQLRDSLNPTNPW